MNTSSTTTTPGASAESPTVAAALASLLDMTPDEVSIITMNELDAMAAERGMKASELVRLAVAE